MTAPNKHKLAILTWCILYPMITVLLTALDPFLRDAAIPIRTLVVTLIIVPAMVYGALPFATSRLRSWLTDMPRS